MSGAVGHINHLYDDRELTFGDLKFVMHMASAGTLERVTEKFDGMNIVFTVNPSTGELSVARSATDIKNGGMSAEALAKKFAGRGHVEDAFVAAFEVIKSATSALSDKVLERIFRGGNVWYSAEVIYPQNTNVIMYDSNNVIVHRWPVFVFEDGVVSKLDDDSGVDAIIAHVDRMQNAVTLKNWRFAASNILSMSSMSDGKAANEATSKLNALMKTTGSTDDTTLYEHLAKLVINDIAHLALPEDVGSLVVDRILEKEGVGIPQIKKAIKDPAQRDAVVNFIKSSERLVKQHVSALDEIISEFAIKVLECVKSTLVADPSAETGRLKKVVEDAVEQIRSSVNDDRSISILARELSRLKSFDSISPVEGIVFFYKGKAYKFTGAFAPINQILGIVRYKR